MATVSNKITCKCGLVLVPVKWKQDRLLWSCRNVVIPTTMRCSTMIHYNSDFGKSHCNTIVEFLNGNDLPEWMKRWSTIKANSLAELCSLRFREPHPFDVQTFNDMIQCLNGYDTTMEEPYRRATEKRKAVQSQSSGPPKKKRRIATIKNQKLDSPLFKNQLSFEQLTSVTVATHQSDTLKRKLKLWQAEREAEIKREIKTCRCLVPKAIQKRIVNLLDREGNTNKNAGKGYWACNDCKFFLWEDVVLEFYLNLQ